jgi:hypothetical protein
MQLADKLTQLAIDNGGATLSTSDASEIRNGYTIGGGILKTADALAEIPASLNAKAIRSQIYISLMLASEELKEFQAVGVWVSNGIVYLDAVTIESNFIKAIVTGISRKQQAIGSLKNGAYEEISTKASVTPTRIKAANKPAMATIEAGVSVLEILTASGLLAGITALGLSQLQAQADTITTQGGIIQQQEEARASQIDNILGGNW